MYKKPLLINSFAATAALAAYTAVKFGADDNTVVAATTATDNVIGFTDEIGMTASALNMGLKVNVVVAGIAEATAGGTVTRGDRLTVNAAGQVVTAAAGNVQCGVAMASAVANSVIPVLINLS